MKSYFLTLDSLTCIEQEDFTGSDDILLRVVGQPDIPVGQIAKNETKLIGREAALGDQSEFTIKRVIHENDGCRTRKK
jgi:hypothetical protein